MKHKLSIIFLSFLTIGTVNAQLQEVSTSTWKSYEIDSEILQEKREIQVYLPIGYQDDHTRYPVLYILDGQRLFDHAVSLAKSFDQFGLTPEFIIVGISNSYPDRFTYFSSRSSLFTRFLEEEVIRTVDIQFRTTEERMIFGWEYGGGFALTLLAKKAELFDGYITASSYPINNKIDMLDSLLVTGVNEPIKLFFSSAQGEGIVNEEAILLKNLLEQKPTNDLTWEYLELANEEHRSTPYSTLFHGIKNYYYYFPILQFASLDEFIEFGGVESVKNYYLKRSEQFGFSPEIPLWTRFSIVRNTIRDDNFVEFKRLYEIYIDQDLILGLRNNQPYTLTDYLIKNDMFHEAIEVYLVLLTKRNESTTLLTKLAEAYENVGNITESEKYMHMAQEAIDH